MRSFAIRLLLLTLVAGMPAAQAVPQTPPPTAPPGQPGGGGRGRGGIQIMTLTSVWPDGGQIPVKHAQPGGDVSPPLEWSNAPATATSFVLIVHDLDSVGGTGLEDALHWMVWNIPGSAKGLAEGVPQGATLPDGTRQISVTGPNYRGPAAPASGPAHHYVFEIYALDTT